MAFTGFIFGIGMNKTGTSSLTAALCVLGYPCLHNADMVKREAKRNRKARRPPLFGLTDHYTAFCDSPINYMFKELDARYPSSRFIFTLRDMADWVRSRTVRWPLTPHEHIKAWQDHEAAVRAHFKDRPQDILWYNLCGGEGWEPLCTFLDVPIPAVEFPWRNKTNPRQLVKAEARIRDNL